MRKHLLFSLFVATSLAMPTFADDTKASDPDSATGPERVDPTDRPAGVGTINMHDDDRMLGNRDDSQTRQLTAGDVDARTDAIYAQIKQSPEKASEKLFLLDAAIGNEWEIESSRLVESKSSDQSVKDLAKMIREDHEQAQKRVTELAREMNLDLPSSLPKSKQNLLAVLGSLPAEKLDSCYLIMQKANHAKAISSYADHQVALEDQSVKSYIGEALPKLREHGQHVVQVASSKNIGSGDFALGDVSSDRDAMGNVDQAQKRQMEQDRMDKSHNDSVQKDHTRDTNRKPTDTNPPR